MPKILLEVPDTREAVTRPVVLDVARQLFTNTKIADDIQIFFPGDLERGQQVGAALTGESEGPVAFSASSMMSISVTETYTPAGLLANAVYRPENLFVFRDDRISTNIRPVYANTTLQLTFKYRAKDKTEATRWRDNIKNRFTQGRETFLHSVTYHYLLPLEMLEILKEIHRLREQVAGYDQDYVTYFDECRTTRATLVTNQAGAQARWGIRETQERVQGWFDFEGVPEYGGKEDNIDTWTISFDYHFSFDKPQACVMHYPLMIHNQLLDQKWRPGPDEQPPFQVEQKQLSYSLSAEHFRMFEADQQMYPQTVRPGYAVPAWDEFFPREIVPTTMRVVTTMLTLNPADLHELANLRELAGDYELNPALDCCLETEWQFMTKPFQSVFCLSLYQGNDLVDGALLTMDADLNIRSTVPLDLRQNYHLRFSLHTDWYKINRAALRRLQHCPDCLINLIDVIDPTIKDKNLLDCVVEGEWFPMRCLENVIDEINRDIIAKGNGQVYQHNTVQSLWIAAHSTTRK